MYQLKKDNPQRQIVLNVIILIRLRKKNKNSGGCRLAQVVPVGAGGACWRRLQLVRAVSACS